MIPFKQGIQDVATQLKKRSHAYSPDPNEHLSEEVRDLMNLAAKMLEEYLKTLNLK